MNVLVKYKSLTLLVTNQDGDMGLLTTNLDEIALLDADTKMFYKNLMAADAEEQASKLEKRKAALNDVKDSLGIIGTPFDSKDAELYALDKKMDYEILELHGNTGNKNAGKGKDFDSRLNMRCHSSDKAGWVKMAQREGLNLQDWVNKALNDAVDGDLAR